MPSPIWRSRLSRRAFTHTNYTTSTADSIALARLTWGEILWDIKPAAAAEPEPTPVKTESYQTSLF